MGIIITLTKYSHSHCSLQHQCNRCNRRLITIKSLIVIIQIVKATQQSVAITMRASSILSLVRAISTRKVTSKIYKAGLWLRWEIILAKAFTVWVWNQTPNLLNLGTRRNLPYSCRNWTMTWVLLHLLITMMFPRYLLNKTFRKSFAHQI